MVLFKCLLCNTISEAAKMACEPCNLDPATSPRDAEMLREVARIHFDPPGKYEGRGLNVAACDSKLRVGVPGHHFTGEKVAVSCPRCKESDVFKGETREPGSSLVMGNLDQQRQAAGVE